jgi:hypothetical protein
MSDIRESLPYDHYEIIEHRRSKIDPDSGLKVRFELGFHCPGCKRIRQRPLDHGEKYTCPECGLEMELFGNSLRCKKVAR